MKRESDTANVFISSGALYSDQQRIFMKSFEDFMLLNDCKPRRIGQVEPGDKPISVVRRTLRSCDGAIIIAFTRLEIRNCIEFPNSSREKTIDVIRVPTIWNQLEGGIAYGLDIPLLILVERGLDRQGILSDGGEWLPLEIDLSASALKDQSFRDVFGKWKESVKERAGARRSTEMHVDRTRKPGGKQRLPSGN